MGFFETLPQISSSSNAFNLDTASSGIQQLITSDTLNIFVWAIIGGICVGIIWGILKRITSWVWR